MERNIQGVAITLSLTHVLHFSVCIKILHNKSILKEILKQTNYSEML